MRVLVTGTAGRVGSVTAKEFLEQGYTVRGLDTRPPVKELRDKIETVYADLTDRIALIRATEGCDAIVHLAAIASPVRGEENIFPVNVTGTQYLLSAAEAHGIKRVALASTCCTYGIYFALNEIDPQYLRVDEKHPVLPQDMYGLSKVFNEETAAAYTRRCGMTTVSLRLTTVVHFEHKEQHPWRRWLASDEDRRNDLWSYVEVCDAARAFRLAIENAPEGTNHTVIIAARNSLTAHDVRHLVKKHFPALVAQVENLAPSDSLYDTSLAERAFGWVAERDWRDLPDMAELKPEFK